MKGQDEYGKRLRRFFRKILVIFALLGFTMAGTVYYVWKTSANTRDALCIYRDDLENRIKLGEKFLKEHPDGAFGFSAETIRANLVNQKRTAESFAIVDCSRAKEE